ncbi:MAG TPA: alpha/beta hydrolase [Chlamydiales bacterium]|nr:alpha/beta hydrolase [Chlamydiales bacterium]
MSPVHYEVFGSGQPAFLLVHNAGGDHHFFDPQIAFLETLGTVIAVDLPGHGKSADDEGPYSICRYAQTLKEICKCYPKIIGIGLNYGANVLIEMGLIDRLVMIDPPLLMDNRTKGFILNHIVELKAIDPVTYAKQIVNSSFLEVNQDVKDKALQSFRIPSPEVRAAVYADLLEWDEDSFNKVEQLSIPTLCIFTDGSLCSMQNLQACNPLIEISKVCRSYYWATLEVPDQVNAMIHRFLYS